MRRALSLFGLSALLVLSACSQDVTSSPDLPRSKPIPVVANSVGACTESQSVEYLQASIDSLMKFLTPNNSSAQSKFTTVLNALAAGDKDGAQSGLQTLINFINLKYGQANTAGVTIKDPVTGVAVPIDQFKNTLIDQLTCFVSLNLFDLNPGDPDKVFSNFDHTAAVWFPHGYVPQGFDVVIGTPSSSPLITDLDVYPSFIDVKLVDGNGQAPAPGTVFNGLPIVVVCFPGTIPAEVAERALLGHQAASGFELLQKTNIPQMLADEVTCGANLPIQTSALGRLIRKAADFLLPEKLFASYFAFGGVGGSPEEFSPFGAVDPGMSFGGAGGSPEEFSRSGGKTQSSTAKQPRPGTRIPLASVIIGGGTTVQGVAGSPDETDPNNLPKVRIATPSGNPIDGVVVTFALSAPDASGNDPITGPESQATLCAGATSVNVTTDADGYAKVPCINFGTKVGYKNLKATFDPTDVDPLACILDATGACAPATTSVNFLVETTPAAASKIVLVPPPAGGSYGSGLAAFVSVSPNPTVRTTDAFDNPVSASVFWQLASTATGASIAPAGPWTSDPTSGLASVTWTLGDGSNGLTAYLGTTASGPSVSFSASTLVSNLAACLASGTTKKTDLAKFVSGSYKGYFSFPSKAKGYIRTANVNMSVTGQSSGSGNYPTTLRAYRKSGSALGTLIATGKPATSDQTLKLPGSNSTPSPIPFIMVPTSSASLVDVGETIILELQITAASTRTFQVWYNTKTDVGTDCYNTVLYTPALVTPNFTTSGFLRGLHLKVTN